MKLTDLLADAGRPVAYHPRLRLLTGSVNATLLLCQLLYWHGKQHDKDGWIYKRLLAPPPGSSEPRNPSNQSLMDETGLTRRELSLARRNLRRRGLVQERYARSEHRLYFRLDLDAIRRAWLDLNREQATKRDAVVHETLPGSAPKVSSLIGTSIEYAQTTAESPAPEPAHVSRAHAHEESDERRLPSTPVEAMRHPDIQLFQRVCGRIPGAAHYQVVIETMRHFRANKGQEAVEYLRPFWLAWSGRRRTFDGKPYDPGSLTWLTEWAVNGNVPPEKGEIIGAHQQAAGRKRGLSPADLAAAGRINQRRRQPQLPALPRAGLSTEGPAGGSS